MGYLADALGEPAEDVADRLRGLAYELFRAQSQQKRRFPRRRVFRVYQEAALRMLRDGPPDVATQARVLLSVLGWDTPLVMGSAPVPGDFPTADGQLAVETFFTVLRGHPLGAGLLRLDPGGWDESEFVEVARRHEVLRELLTHTITLGHPLVELWRAYVGHRGSLQLRGEGPEPTTRELTLAFLDRLSTISSAVPSALSELQDLVANVDLVIDVNFPQLRTEPLPRIPSMLRNSLSSQTPIAGMSGRINARVVQQFRMPGYPYVLVTTDVLQEGEDLHTFAARVMHYGITWTPSAMEQRTGRVDRIGSLVHRRLTRLGAPDPERFLQVQFPYLDGTVELFQVREIFRRMDEFVALLHKGLGADEAKQSAIRLSSAIHERAAIKEPSSEPLPTPFRVDEELLHRDLPSAPAVQPEDVARYETHFASLLGRFGERFLVTWDIDQHAHGGRLGTVWVRDRRLASSESRARRQPVGVQLRSDGSGAAFLTVFSPVGVVPIDDDRSIEQLFALQKRLPTAKICAVVDVKRETYNLTTQVDLPFHPDTLQLDELVSAIQRCAVTADAVEHALLGTDAPLETFARELRKDLADA